jgi:hypothetical protein
MDSLINLINIVFFFYQYKKYLFLFQEIYSYCNLKIMHYEFYFADTSPPIMRCPRDIETEADADDSSAEVVWRPPVALDNSGIRPLVTVLPAIEPPKRFPIGFTKVKYVAEDLSGNKVKCTFTVRVKGKYFSFPINRVKKSLMNVFIMIPKG